MFYDNFVNLCAAKGLSPSAVALELGITKSNVTYWKKGRNNPSDVTLAKIADYFGVSVYELLHGQKEKSPTPEGVELTETQQRALDLIIQLDETSLKRFIKVLEAFAEGHPDE